MSVYVENKTHNNPVTLAKYLPTYDLKSKYTHVSTKIHLLGKQGIQKIAFWIERST